MIISHTHRYIFLLFQKRLLIQLEIG